MSTQKKAAAPKKVASKKDQPAEPVAKKPKRTLVKEPELKTVDNGNDLLHGSLSGKDANTKASRIKRLEYLKYMNHAVAHYNSYMQTQPGYTPEQVTYAGNVATDLHTALIQAESEVHG